MKEASGELNLTVVVVMAVAALMALPWYGLQFETIWHLIQNVKPLFAKNVKIQMAVPL